MDAKEVNLTEFDAALAAKAIGDIGDRLHRAARKLYPGVDWKLWTSEMWDKIYEKAEEEWKRDQGKTVGG